MKIQNSRNETIPLAKAAELPVQGDGDTAEEVLASTPDIPVCSRCEHKTAEVDKDGICQVCAGRDRNFFAALAKETERICESVSYAIPATDENLAKAEAQLEKDASSVVVPPRPSLEVETEVHDNLRPRIEAHLGRMRAWDLRKIRREQEQQVRAAIVGVDLAWTNLADALNMLHGEGFVAKTTPVTRMASKLTHGAKVSMRDDQRAIFAKVYTKEQLDTLFVAKVYDTHVQLMADDGSNLGLVKIIHVVPKP
jgi:hypothetical protein